MPLTTIPDYSPGEIIASAWANTLKANQSALDSRTGGDPSSGGGAGRFLVATGGLTGGWRLLQAGDYQPGTIPDSALAVAKVNRQNPELLTFASALSYGSGFFQINPGAADSPNPGLLWLMIQNRIGNWAGGDWRNQIAVPYNDPTQLWMRGVLNGSPTAWVRIALANGVVQPNLNADLLDGYGASNGGGGIPIANGLINTNLYAQTAENANIANTATNASQLGGRVSGHDHNQIPIADTTLCTSLNADMFDGQHGTYYLARANHTGTQAPAAISPQGTGSGLNAGLLEGMTAAQIIASASAGGMPPNTIVGFATAAQIPSGFTRLSTANGRLVVVDGTVGEQGFSGGNTYGSTWNHGHSAPGHTHTLNGHTHGGPNHSHDFGHGHTGGTTSGVSGFGSTNENFQHDGGDAVAGQHSHTSAIGSTGSVQTGNASGTTGTPSSDSTSSVASGINAVTLTLPMYALVLAVKS